MSTKERVWRLHEAKAHFGELFRPARCAGPQRVVNRRGEAVMIVSAGEFDRMNERTRQPGSLVDFFRSALTGGSPLHLARKRDTSRRLKAWR